MRQRHGLRLVRQALSGYTIRHEDGVTIITIRLAGLTITIEIPP